MSPTSPTSEASYSFFEKEKPLENPKAVALAYRYWRIRTFYSLYFGYVLFYFSRRSFTSAMPALIETGHYTMADLGTLGSVLYVTYGFSKFLSGVQSDRSNPRFFMSIGLILTGFTNILFGMSSQLWVLALLWGVNGWFQGWGWPACTKLLTHWWPRKERGSWWGLVSTSHNVGGGLIPLLVASVVIYGGWRWAMIVPGVICIIGGLFLLERLRDVPEALGLPPVEKFEAKEKSGNTVRIKPKKALPIKEILWNQVLKNSSLWMLAISYFFVYVVRTGINDWAPMYLVKQRGYSLVTASSTVASFEVGGAVGTLLMGWGSDVLFRGKRMAPMLLCSVGLLGVVYGFWKTPFFSPFWDHTFMGTLGALIFGPQMLVGLAAAETVHKGASATANGFVGFLAYLGAAATGYPLGKVIDTWGWQGFFWVMMICSLFMTGIFIRLWWTYEIRPFSHSRSRSRPCP